RSNARAGAPKQYPPLSARRFGRPAETRHRPEVRGLPSRAETGSGAHRRAQAAEEGNARDAQHFVARAGVPGRDLRIAFEAEAEAVGAGTQAGCRGEL